MGKFVRGGLVVPVEKVRALQYADQIIAEAEERATTIIASARAEAEEIRCKASASGLDQARNEAAAMISAATLKREELLSGVQRDVVSLAMERANKVSHRELDLRPELIAELCGDVIQQVLLASSVIMHVHPDDLAVVRGRQDALSERLEKGASFRIVEDETIGRGGCVIESDMGRIDARLETQLAAIERALLADDD